MAHDRSHLVVILALLGFAGCWLVAGTDEFSEESAASTQAGAGMADGGAGHGGSGGLGGAAIGGAATGGDAIGGGSGGEGPCAGAKIVFVTSQTYLPGSGTGEFLGRNGGNQRCKDLADAAMLPGTFDAWLSDDTTNAKDVLVNGGPWCTLDDGLVFLDLSSVGNGPGVPIDVDEAGAAVGSGTVWTGTDVDGNLTFNNCMEWTVTTGNLYEPTLGDLKATNANWTDNGNNVVNCDVPRRLYCFQTAP